MTTDIIYEDKAVIVCIKSPGLDSQNEMRNALKETLGLESFCVHRLDKEVGGVMVYAKTAAAAAALSAAIAGRRMDKEYLAVASGRPEADEGILKDLLFRDAAKNKSYVVKRMRKGVREAELEYRVIETAGDISLLHVKLHTGRSHQIRVQFASRGMPLLGDTKYGSKLRNCKIALWSWRLAFPHPDTGEMMNFTALPHLSFPWDEFAFLRQGII